MKHGLFSLFSQEFLQQIQQWGLSPANIQLVDCKKITYLPYRYGSLREALANAVAHGFYEDNVTTCIEINVFPSKLEIKNRMHSYARQFSNQWFVRNHFSFNRTLIDTLRIYKPSEDYGKVSTRLLEELGSGKVYLMRAAYEDGKQAPTVEVNYIAASASEWWTLTLYDGILYREEFEKYKQQLKEFLDSVGIPSSYDLLLILLAYRYRELNSLFVSVKGEMKTNVRSLIKELTKIPLSPVLIKEVAANTHVIVPTDQVAKLLPAIK